MLNFQPSVAQRSDYPPDIRSKAADVALQQLCAVGGYSQLPNILLDRLRGVLNRNEYDVFLYIVRRTLGFHKLEDAISLSQFQGGIVSRTGKRLDYGCGLKSGEAITKALRELERLGFITRQEMRLANGGHGSNVYTLCISTLLASLTEPDEQNGFSSAAPDYPTAHDEELAATQGTDTAPHEIALPVKRGHKIPDSQNQDQNDSTNMGVAVAADDKILSSGRIVIDTTLLTDFGFDRTTALRLAILAEQVGQDEHYVSGIIRYCLKHAHNPVGMARRLIEQGETRTELPSRSTPATNRPRFSGWTDDVPAEAEPTTMLASAAPEALPDVPRALTEHQQSLLLTALSDPRCLLQAFEDGHECEDDVLAVLRRLNLTHKFEQDLTRIRRLIKVTSGKWQVASA